MKVILILLVILEPLRMAAVGAICPQEPHLICPNVSHVSAPTACSNACGTKFLYDHCMDAMRLGGIDLSPSHTEEATVYAIIAVYQAVDSFTETTDCLGRQLENMSLSGQDRDNYRDCIYDLEDASTSLKSVGYWGLCRCNFGIILDKYMSSITSTERCRDRMLAPKVPPLYPDVIRDRNKVVTAYLLGKLLAVY